MDEVHCDEWQCDIVSTSDELSAAITENFEPLEKVTIIACETLLINPLLYNSIKIFLCLFLSVVHNVGHNLIISKYHYS